MSYTKGPWEIDWYICKERDKELWRVPLSIGPLSTDKNHWAGDHLSVSEANARLMASAPELLEALEAMVMRIEINQASGVLPVGVNLYGAKKAIAKAKGE